MNEDEVSIEKLIIRNIRGYADTELGFNLLPNFANIVVAPNGFGKSSISTAFLCAQGTKLDVKKNDKHLHQESPSVLKIMINGKWLTADADTNEISKFFNLKVIKSAVTPKAKMPRINGFAVARPYLAIDDIELKRATPKIDLTYNANEFKEDLAPNQKISPNLPKLCDGGGLRSFLLSHLGEVDNLKTKSSQSLFDDLRSFIKSQSGTKIAISASVEVVFGPRIGTLVPLLNLMNGLHRVAGGLLFSDRLLIIYQLTVLRERDRTNLKKWLEYGDYKDWFSGARDFIADVNKTWATAKIEERKGKVLATFPEAGNLSNGQRDLLYFSCSLLKVRDAGSNKPTLLLIDEVFDYLDDANLLVAQYFLSNIIEYYKKRSNSIYIAILTHLDPVFFKGYALKKQKVTYLENSPHSISETMRKVIIERENPDWKDDLDKYFLHFHVDDRDISAIFNEKFSLPKRHGTKKGFYKFLEQEWNNAFSGGSDYDPFAVCAYLRINVERCAFEKLSTEEQCHTFLNTNGTKSKLDYVEQVGVAVPEICFLLAGLYNDAMHKKGDLEKSSAVALKIRNLALKNMMRAATNW